MCNLFIVKMFIKKCQTSSEEKTFSFVNFFVANFSISSGEGPNEGRGFF
jgi:hypothetical protein